MNQRVVFRQSGLRWLTEGRCILCVRVRVRVCIRVPVSTLVYAYPSMYASYACTRVHSCAFVFVRVSCVYICVCVCVCVFVWVKGGSLDRRANAFPAQYLLASTRRRLSCRLRGIAECSSSSCRIFQRFECR